MLWILCFRLNLKKKDQDREVLVIYIRGPPEWEATVRAGSSRMGSYGLCGVLPNGGGPRSLHHTIYNYSEVFSTRAAAALQPPELFALFTPFGASRRP